MSILDKHTAADVVPDSPDTVDESWASMHYVPGKLQQYRQA
jgi:hypothetical protein